MLHFELELLYKIIMYMCGYLEKENCLCMCVYCVVFLEKGVCMCVRVWGGRGAGGGRGGIVQLCV